MICVPTPVTKVKDRDHGPVTGAAKTVGQNLKEGAIVVLESTVYPGVTEEIPLPVLEQESGKRCGRDFFVVYSPEWINPNDDEYTLERKEEDCVGYGCEKHRYAVPCIYLEKF